MAAVPSDHPDSTIGCYFPGPRFKRAVEFLMGHESQGTPANEGLKSGSVRKGQEDDSQLSTSQALCCRRGISVSEAGGFCSNTNFPSCCPANSCLENSLGETGRWLCLLRLLEQSATRLVV